MVSGLIAGQSPSTTLILQARDYLRDRGTLAILGLPPHAKLTLPILETMLRGIRVVGCFVGNRQDAVEALELHASGRVGLSIHMSNPVDLLINRPNCNTSSTSLKMSMAASSSFTKARSLAVLSWTCESLE
jgi:hypothetical protein